MLMLLTWLMQAQVKAKNKRLEDLEWKVIQACGVARRRDVDKTSALNRVNYLTDRHRQQAAHVASLTLQLQQSHSREQNLVAQGATKDAELLRRAQDIAAKDADLLQRAHAITAKDGQIQALQAQLQVCRLASDNSVYGTYNVQSSVART